MTLKELSKLAEIEQRKDTQEQIIKRFHNVPFWRWDLPVDKHYRLYKAQECNCYNCQIKWARKNNYEYPLFDYEKRYLDALERDRLVATIKCRASGISEVTLRYLEWLALRNKKLTGTQMIIAASAAEEQTLSFMRRIRAHLEPVFGTFETREKTLLINGVRIQTVPSHNLLQIRGQTNVSALILEESSFWHESEEREILPIILPLRQKNPEIIISLISTPGRIGSLMHQIHMAPVDKTPFTKVYVPFSDVVGKLFSLSEIEEAKRTNPAFQREYNLEFGFGVEGGLFNYSDLEDAIELAEDYREQDPKYIDKAVANGQNIIGYDPSGGGSSSKHAITMLTLYNGRVIVTYASQFSASQHTEDDIIDLLVNKLWAFGTRKTANIFVDFAQPTMLRKIKTAIRVHDETEVVDVERHLDFIRKHNFLQKDYRNIGQQMIACPISFGTFGPMLLHKLATAFERGWVVLDESLFPDLVSQLKQARTKPNSTQDWQLDKSQHDMDLIDSTRLACFPIDV